MTDCDLRGAVLDGAILARVRLVNANLSTASLKNANFAWADLRRALFGSKNLSEAQTFGVVRDDASSPHVEPVTISGNDVRALRLGV
jgi:uncharacterized protein YjbI with pentapeptide repeats